MVRLLTVGRLATILLRRRGLALVLSAVTATRRRVLALRRISARGWVVGLLALAVRPRLATLRRLRAVLVATVRRAVVLVRWLTRGRRVVAVLWLTVLLRAGVVLLRRRVGLRAVRGRLVVRGRRVVLLR